MDKNTKIVVTGSTGFVGRNLMRILKDLDYTNVTGLSSREYNLIDRRSVRHMYYDLEPRVVIHLAARCGGIQANMKAPGQFIYDNLQMGINLIDQGRICNLPKFVFLGTVCSYPEITPVPFKESDLWNGYPEPTNAPYGVAKKTLMTMLDAYEKEYNFNSTVLVPSNMFGIDDSFNDNKSHVIPALIKKFLYAQENELPSVTCWGNINQTTRDFLYVEDTIDAIIKSLDIKTTADPINLGSGKETSIKELACLIKYLTGYHGDIIENHSLPSGQPRRCLDTARAKDILGWEAKTPLIDGIRKTINWYIAKEMGLLC